MVTHPNSHPNTSLAVTLMYRQNQSNTIFPLTCLGTEIRVPKPPDNIMGWFLSPPLVLKEHTLRGRRSCSTSLKAKDLEGREGKFQVIWLKDAAVAEQL